MSYVYTVGLKVIVEEVLTALTETPTVYAYDFLTGDALTSPAPTITSVRTGVYRLSVTANVLTDVLFVFIPHQDDEDKIGQEALMHEKMYHVVDELANGVTLVDGAITANKIASNAITTHKLTDEVFDKISNSVLAPIVEDITGFIGGFNPDMEVSGAGTAEVNGIYRYAGKYEGRPKYVKDDCEIYNADSIWGIFYQNSPTYIAFEDVLTPDLIAEWMVADGLAPVPTVTVMADDTSLYAQLAALRDLIKLEATYPDILVEGAGTAEFNGIYKFGEMYDGRPRYYLDAETPYDDINLRWHTNQWILGYANNTPFYHSTEDVPTPDLVTTWQSIYGGLPVPTVTIAPSASDTSLYAQLEAIRGAGWTSESLKAIADAIDSIDSGLDAAGVRTAIGLASANLDTQLSSIKTDTGNVATRLTAVRAGYLDKLNVAGILANTINAGDFKADVSGLATSNALSTTDGKVDAIKAKTDNLPASPAGVGAAMTLTSAYDAAKTAASQLSVNAIPTTPLLAANYTAPDNASITAIKAKTDNLPASPAVAGEYTGALADIQTDLDNPSQYKADISALATSAEVGALNNITAAEVLAEEVIGGYSLAQVLTALAAKMHGLASGAGTTTIAYDGIDGTPNVVVETVDGKGNRSNVVLNI